MNSVILIGRLARDPELTYTSTTQTAWCKFTLAVDRPKRNGEDQGADFIRIQVWGKQAETCDRYLTKGRQVAVMGHINTGSYPNKDGQTIYYTDVVADRVEFLGSQGENRRSDGSSQKNGTSHNEAPQNANFAGTGFTSTDEVPPWA